MIDVLRIAHLRIAPQEGNSEVGNCEVHRIFVSTLQKLNLDKFTFKFRTSHLRG